MARIGYDPANALLGGFSPLDGTIEFYGRVNALLESHMHVLDLGAGRGAWHYEDHVPFRRALRNIRPKVTEYIGADVDEAVLANPTTSRNLVIKDGCIALDDATMDLVICDYVLEHVRDVDAFSREIERVMKPGAIFCGRTPHALNYVSLGARLVKNARHPRLLASLQPNRKAEDVFATLYRCNTLGAVRRTFRGWEDYSYLYASEPQYYFGSETAYRFFSGVHKLVPAAFTGNLFVFLRKPSE